MEIENMINDIARKYGLEAPATIAFCEKTKSMGIIYLIWLYYTLML